MILKMMLAIFLYKVTILTIRILLKVLVKVLSNKVDPQSLEEINLELQKIKEWIDE